MFNPRKALGIFLIVVGILFLLANNNLLWFGWEALWPIVPFLIGLAIMGMYRARRKPRQLFVGTLLLQYGFLFFLFSSGILGWERMPVFWPLFPLMLGVSVILVALVVEDQASPLIVGFTAVVFGVVSLLFSTGTVESRVADPFIRFWPVLLVAAGAAILWQVRQSIAQNADEKSGREETPDGADESPTLPRS